MSVNVDVIDEDSANCSTLLRTAQIGMLPKLGGITCAIDIETRPRVSVSDKVFMIATVRNEIFYSKEGMSNK